VPDRPGRDLGSGAQARQEHEAADAAALAPRPPGRSRPRLVGGAVPLAELTIDKIGGVPDKPSPRS